MIPDRDLFNLDEWRCHRTHDLVGVSLVPIAREMRRRELRERERRRRASARRQWLRSVFGRFRVWLGEPVPARRRPWEPSSVVPFTQRRAG